MITLYTYTSWIKLQICLSSRKRIIQNIGMADRPVWYSPFLHYPHQSVARPCLHRRSVGWLWHCVVIRSLFAQQSARQRRGTPGRRTLARPGYNFSMFKPEKNEKYPSGLARPPGRAAATSTTMNAPKPSILPVAGLCTGLNAFWDTRATRNRIVYMFTIIQTVL